jgi:hypothetical protein
LAYGGKMRRFIVLILLSIIIVSCGEDEKKVFEPKVIDWPDRTSQEHCIEIVVLVYENFRLCEIEKYGEALLAPDAQAEEFAEGYYWHFWWWDIDFGDPDSIDFDADMNITEQILQNAVKLELEIGPGTWDTLQTFRGEPCENCWSTEREYWMRAQFDNEGMMYCSDPGESAVRFVVGPDPYDPSRYVIYEIVDMDYDELDSPRGIVGSDESSQTERSSWGAIKLLFH